MTKGPWKYKKANDHHHVLMGDEVLDVNKECDARIIALVPEMVKLLENIDADDTNELEKLYKLSNKIFRIINGNKTRK